MASPAPDVDLSRVRDIGIAAHIDAGKTTLTERILFYTGANHKIGEVHDGDSHMDYQDEERQHGITITSAVTKCPWRDHLIQVIDTPGHVDFTIEVERALRVLDGAVIVLDGVRGVEPQTETVWRQASKFDIPTLFFVNKMDRPGADFDRAMRSIKTRFKIEPVPVTVPVHEGCLDLLSEKLLIFHGEKGEELQIEEVPSHLRETLRAQRENLLLALGDFDETIAEAVLSEEPVDRDTIIRVLREQTLARRLYPTFGGSALRNRGVQPLLDAILELLPSPLDRPPAKAHTLEGQALDVPLDPKGPFLALAFKVQLWEGRRHVFARVYRGRVEPGDSIRIAGTDTVERVARIFDVDAEHKKRMDVAVAGQILLIAGLRRSSTGDTLCAPAHPLLLERIDSREPVLGLAVEPERSADEEKMLEVIHKVLEEDPTLRFEEDKDTGQRILKGMGELHLQIVFERIQREFGVKIRAGRPHVVSRETILGSATARGLIDHVIELENNKRIEMRAAAVATVRPLERGKGIEIEVKPIIRPEGCLSSAQMDAVVAGTNDALVGGPIDGAPLQDLSVRLDEVEIFGPASSVQALRIAAAQAVRNAMAQAGGVMLGPIMKVEVVVPEESLGAALGDLQARRAAILGSETELGMASIQAECPLAALLGYATDLRSLTRGRGQFTSEFDRFDLNPDS